MDERVVDTSACRVLMPLTVEGQRPLTRTTARLRPLHDHAGPEILPAMRLIVADTHALRFTTTLLIINCDCQAPEDTAAAAVTATASPHFDRLNTALHSSHKRQSIADQTL